MKTLTGQEFEVLGEIAVNNLPHVICKMSPFYKNDILISLIVLPKTMFVERDKNFEVEVLSTTPYNAQGETNETSPIQDQGTGTTNS
jgi:hypothetical protein